MSTGNRRTLRIRITGHVQGVAFRDWMERSCRELGLTGWVRNRRDGSVEAVISGDPDLVADMLELCRRGPPAAQVSDVAVLGEVDAVFTAFDIKPSA